MERQTHALHIAVRIPSDVSSETIIHLLHDHKTLMSLQPLVIRTEPLPSDPASAGIEHYSFTESIPILPFLGAWGRKEVTSTAMFRDMEDSVQSEASAPLGIVVRARWRAREGGEGGKEDGIRELVEDVSVEAPGWLMWFVKGQMESAHREICEKIIARCQGKI